MGRKVRDVVGWRSQPGPQRRFLRCSAFEAVYGGARGGGKTDGSLGDFLWHQNKFGAGAKGLFVRRHLSDLTATIARAKQIYGAANAVFNAQRSQFTFPNGATIRFQFLGRDEDAERYQGHDFTRVYVEELTQFPDPRPVDKLKATLRSAAGVPCGFRATCNPGGPGHTWVKQRYIDGGAWDEQWEAYQNPFTEETQRLGRVFIPAKLSDNRILMKADPLYAAKLQQSGSPVLVRAWLEGDWNIVEGAFFDAWSMKNVIRPVALPAHWTRFRSFDWGSARPFSVGWWAVAAEDLTVREGVIPKGAIVREREWYGSSGKANEGLKLTAEEVAFGIRQREKDRPASYGVADPSIWQQNGGPSIAERMARAGVVFRPADNSRVARGGPQGGWDRMRALIKGEGGRPKLYVFDTCRDFLRTVPVLRHDPDRPEDIDSEAEDHIADETRYACMSRVRPRTDPDPTRNPADLWSRRRGAAAGSWKTV